MRISLRHKFVEPAASFRGHFESGKHIEQLPAVPGLDEQPLAGNEETKRSRAVDKTG
jgi:hypothetical protein